MNSARLKVPQQLADHYFYTVHDEVVCLERYLEEGHFFAYEMLYYNGEEAVNPPWSHRDKAVKDVLAAWNEEEGILIDLFRSRDTSVKHRMKKGIALFYMLLFWSNSVPVVLREWPYHMEKLTLKPVNVEERLSFIRQNPKLYHSFVQLKELFQEQHKQIAKDMAINNTINIKK